ncbi:MAG: cell cycle transcriptional regulator TrcR [Parvularculales bacterium]
MPQPLMPKATAVWLVDNTTLTFDQIADFCGLHPLEVKGIADGDVAQGILGISPISNGQISREDLERCQAEETARLALIEQVQESLGTKKKSRYTPVSRRQSRPDAISWLLRHHPELNDAQIGRLVNTTKATIKRVRERSHWNTPNITPTDPVVLGLCTQIEMDEAVSKAAARVERARKKEEREARKKEKDTANVSLALVGESRSDVTSAALPESATDNAVADASASDMEERKTFSSDQP